MRMTRVAVLAGLIFVGDVAQAAELKGVAKVVNGDTLSIGTTALRLENIHAPETDQVCLDAKAELWPCGIDARNQLVTHIADREISCTLKAIEAASRRTLATCYLAGEDLNGWMVEQGWALPYFRRSFTYVDAERNAQTGKRGLWQGAFVAPWEWRRRNKNTALLGVVSVPTNAQAILFGPSSTANAPSPQCTIKGNITRLRKRIYHVESQHSYANIKMDKGGRRWFCTTEEAEAAGWRKASR